ncbi:hypothetical protein [Candidatus Solirubrobacter pratensis]|uniref:hypothetical protein n=1 Tax=Candidatus Solirubrobacter pratensis TaxID=1298857 RepID=UPI000481129B|nr:hypothetical protein [Candidatus Solirubrobacter pratensis]
MPLGFIRCPDCHARGRRSFARPQRATFDGLPAPVFDEERVCLRCGAWLWVAGADVMPAAPRLLTLSAAPPAELAERLEAVLEGIAATQAFQREFQRASSAACPSATVKRFS